MNVIMLSVVLLIVNMMNVGMLCRFVLQIHKIRDRNIDDELS
jgi:hypothetical protein